MSEANGLSRKGEPFRVYTTERLHRRGRTVANRVVKQEVIHEFTVTLKSVRDVDWATKELLRDDRLEAFQDAVKVLQQWFPDVVGVSYIQTYGG